MPRKAAFAGAFEKAIGYFTSKWFCFEAFCFSALSGIVSNGRMEFDDGKNQQTQSIC